MPLDRLFDGVARGVQDLERKDEDAAVPEGAMDAAHPLFDGGPRDEHVREPGDVVDEDVVEICEYVSAVCETLDDGPACFFPSVSAVVRGMLENATLRDEERGTYDEFVDACRGVADENRDDVDPALFAHLPAAA